MSDQPRAGENPEDMLIFPHVTNDDLLAILIKRGAVGVKKENGRTFLWFDPDKVTVPDE